MRCCEQEGVHYGFKLRLTRGVRRLLEKAMGADDWRGCRPGLVGPRGAIALEGTAGDPPAPPAEGAGGHDGRHRRRPGCERLVLGPIGQGRRDDVGVRRARHLPRPRGSARWLSSTGIAATAKIPSTSRENHWGWVGFTTHDRKRCRIDRPPDRARLQLVDAVRAARPIRTITAEALTSRPLLLHGIARQTRHAGRTPSNLPSPRSIRTTCRTPLSRTAASGTARTLRGPIGDAISSLAYMSAFNSPAGFGISIRTLAVRVASPTVG